MTQSAILTKLEKLLARAIRSEAEGVYLLAETRKLLEQQDAKKRYEYLTFHCDWALHAKLTGSTAQRILTLFDDPNVHLKACVTIPPSLTKRERQHVPTALYCTKPAKLRNVLYRTNREIGGTLKIPRLAEGGGVLCPAKANGRRANGKDQAPTQLARSVNDWPSETATHKPYDAIFNRWLTLYAARNARTLRTGETTGKKILKAVSNSCRERPQMDYAKIVETGRELCGSGPSRSAIAWMR